MFTVPEPWISVYDHLPPQGERVLATDGAFVGEMYINKRGQWQRYNVNDSSLMMALDILWWMPLPEPPKAEPKVEPIRIHHYPHELRCFPKHEEG